MTNVKKNLLLAMPIFGGISPAVVEFILDKASTVHIKTGNFFFREGEIASSMFVLEKGLVEVFRDWNGMSHTLRKLGIGDCFGEMALMDCSLRSASVRAKYDCSAIEITAAGLAEIYDVYPDQYTLIQMNIGREVVRRLRETDSRLMEKNIEQESATAAID